MLFRSLVQRHSLQIQEEALLREEQDCGRFFLPFRAEQGKSRLRIGRVLAGRVDEIDRGDEQLGARDVPRTAACDPLGVIDEDLFERYVELAAAHDVDLGANLGIPNEDVVAKHAEESEANTVAYGDRDHVERVEEVVLC